MIRRSAVSLLVLAALCAPSFADDTLPLGEFIRVEDHPTREKVVRASIRVYTAPKPDPKNSPLGQMGRMMPGMGNSKPAPRPEIVLMSMIHFGEKEYFAKVNELLKTADLVLYEEQGDQMMSLFGAETLSQLTDLSFQAVEVKPNPKTWRSADLTQDQTFRALGVDPAILKRMGQMMKRMGGMRMDKNMLKRMPGMDQFIPNRDKIMLQIQAGAMQKNAMPGKMGDLILRQRNAIAIGEMTKASYEIDKKRIVLIYGAAHMSEVEAYLRGPLGYTHKSTKWIDAVYKTPQPTTTAPAPAVKSGKGSWY